MQNLLHQLAGVDPLAVGHTSVRRPAILLKVYINIAIARHYNTLPSVQLITSSSLYTHYGI